MDVNCVGCHGRESRAQGRTVTVIAEDRKGPELAMCVVIVGGVAGGMSTARYVDATQKSCILRRSLAGCDNPEGRGGEEGNARACSKRLA